MTQQPFSRPGAIDLSALKRPAAPPAGAGATGATPAGASYWLEVDEESFQATLEASIDGARPAGVLLAEQASRERADGPRPGDGRRGVRGTLPRRPRRHRRLARDRTGRAAPVGALRLRGPRRPPGPADPGRHEARRPAWRDQPGHAAADRAGHDRPSPAARPGRERTDRGRGRRAAGRPPLRRRRRTRWRPTTTTVRSPSTRSSSTPTRPTPRRLPVWPWRSCCCAPRTSTSTRPGRRPPRAPDDVGSPDPGRRPRHARRPRRGRVRPAGRAGPPVPPATTATPRASTCVGLFAAVGNDDPRVLKGRQALANALF